MGAWDTYKNNYKGKTDVKARKEGYATQDTTSKGEDVVKRKLVQSYSYSISVIDAKDTIQRLKNFNDNMMHIRIIGRAEPEFLYHQRLYLREKEWKSSKR